jgi:hypothetical protein
MRMERIDTGEGFTILDGGALVMGSAIASIHILGVRRWELSGSGWLMVAITFTWTAVTASGPFLFAERRYVRHVLNYPRIGDRLWALLGMPWLLTALAQSAVPSSEPRHNQWLIITLSSGLAIACLTALAVVWSTWVIVPPQQAAQIEAAPWTNRVGLILAIAWPIQCGLGMVVLS